MTNWLLTEAELADFEPKGTPVSDTDLYPTTKHESLDITELSHTEFYAHIERQKRAYQKHISSNRKVPAVYAGESETITALGYVLDTGCDASEALTHTARIYGMDAAWIATVKAKRPYKIRTALKHHEDHPMFNLMKANGRYRPGYIAEGSTLNAALNRARQEVIDTREHIAMKEELASLKALQDAQQLEIERLKAVHLLQEIHSGDDKSHEDHTERIKEHEQSLKSIDWRGLALAMRENSAGYKKIAKATGKTPSAIRHFLSKPCRGA